MLHDTRALRELSRIRSRSLFDDALAPSFASGPARPIEVLRVVA